MATLAGLIALARRRANRRLLVGALATALLPAVGVALLWKGLALIVSFPVAMLSVAIPVLVGLAAGLVLYAFRRLDTAGAALLLDRRAGTQERCVTGHHLGGRVARDAECRMDRDRVCEALAFRPPATALAVLLASGALAALYLLPGLGTAPNSGGPRGVEAVLSGSGGVDADGSASATAPEDDPEADPGRDSDVLRWIDRAEAPLATGPVTEDLAEARAALERGDRDGARSHLESALAAQEGEDAISSRRIRKALDAAGGASRGTGPSGLADRVDWGQDAGLVRRYLLEL